MPHRLRKFSIISLLMTILMLTLSSNFGLGHASGSPLIDMPTYSSVTAVTATLGATIESDGGSSINESGIVYGTTANPYITDNKIRSDVTAGPFTVEVSGLTPNTTYHFRGYAINDQGTSFTDDATFITGNGVFYKWQAHEFPGPAYWSTIASSSDGTKLVAAGDYLFTSTDSGATWSRRLAAGSRGWKSVASSSDGTKLVAAEDCDSNDGGYIYTSNDSGATWTPQTGSGRREWRAVASSSDGTKLVAAESDQDFGGYIYTSSDSGATWTRTSAVGRFWSSVASSSDGTKLVAVDYGVGAGWYVCPCGGYIYTSTDSGATWTKQTSTGIHQWVAVASSSDGTKLVAAAGSIYTSIDSGATWSQQTNAGMRQWCAVASSSDGTKLVALESSPHGYIYTSSDSGATWTQQASAGSREWQAIATSSDGIRLVAGGSGSSIYTSVNSGDAWTQQASPGSFSWPAAASSSDGTKLVVAQINGMAVVVGGTESDPDGYIFTSIDAGGTWTQKASAGNRNWQAIASSSDGVKLIAADQGWVEGGGYIYLTTDSGATWTQQMSAGKRVWVGVASSSDGVKLIGVEWGGYIYSSNDSGATWIQQTSAGRRNWDAVASSSDGTQLVAADYGEDSGGYIYTSSDSGASWTQQTSAGNRSWQAVASSSDGVRLVAVENGDWNGGKGYIYTSTDSGATWTQQASVGKRYWRAVASSSDGTKLVAAENGGYIYVSADSGENWTPQTSVGTQYWGSLASSADGSKLIVTEDAGCIVTGSAPTLPLVDTPSTSSITTTSATLGATIESDGYASITEAGVAYGLNANPGITGNKVETDNPIGQFVVGVTGLTPNTLYHFRGYATNSEGTGYTDDSTVTAIANAPTATFATGPNSTGFTANWTAPAGTALITGYRLDVSTDSGFTSIVADYNDLAISGTSKTVTGLSPNRTYYYRVRAVNAGGTSSNSNTVTTITPAPPLMSITSPKGNEQWAAGSKQTISWTYNGTPGARVRIELLKSGSVKATIASSVSVGKGGSGSCAWTLPTTLKGTDYQVRVTSTTNSGYTATSKSSFTIVGPTITNVSVSQNLIAGGKCTVSWNYTGSPGNVKIELLGSPGTIIKSSTSAGKNYAGSYTWTIPKKQPTGDHQVKVTAVAHSECSSTSSSFNIAGPTITVLSPNGTEHFTAGGKMAISWKHTGSPGNVRIDLLKGGNPITAIKSSTSAGKNGTGSYSWKIPKTQATGSDYKIRATATSGPACTDESDNNFSIGNVQASAGPDQHAKASALVRLNGLNSTGVKEESASYGWTQTHGPTVLLSDPNAAETIFLAPEGNADGTSLGFLLTVTNGEGVKSEDSCIVNVSENNVAPIAEVGLNQVAAVAQIVEMDGSQSSASSPIASYNWRQVSGIPVTLTDASAMQTTFVAPDVDAAGECLIFELTVTDKAGLRSRDTCIVNVISNDRPPTALAGANRTVSAGSEALLDGSGSTDTDNGIASYRWRQLSGKPVLLSAPTGMKTTFISPDIDSVKEDLVFELTVTDTAGLQDKSKVVISIVPVSSAGGAGKK